MFYTVMNEIPYKFRILFKISVRNTYRNSPVYSLPDSKDYALIARMKLYDIKFYKRTTMPDFISYFVSLNETDKIMSNEK